MNPTTAQLDTTSALPLSAPVNLRDLGGIRTATGVIRNGTILRADDLSLITTDFAADMVAAGLSAVIDLRSAQETRATGRGPLAEHGVAYHHLPLFTRFPTDPATFAGPLDAVGMGLGYADLYESSAGALVNALALTAFNRGAVAFHCAAGKDRTGVLAAAILLALGSHDDVIVADYAATGPNVPAIMARLEVPMGRLMAAVGIDLSQYAAAATGEDFSDEAMATMLRTLRDRHGDPLAPLRAAGLTDGLIDTLNRRVSRMPA